MEEEGRHIGEAYPLSFCQTVSLSHTIWVQRVDWSANNWYPSAGLGGQGGEGWGKENKPYITGYKILAFPTSTPFALSFIITKIMSLSHQGGYVDRKYRLQGRRTLAYITVAAYQYRPTP